MTTFVTPDFLSPGYYEEMCTGIDIIIAAPYARYSMKMRLWLALGGTE